MKIVLILIAALLFFSGLVWFMQGINLLPDSFMTGQTQWALYGGLATYDDTYGYDQYRYWKGDRRKFVVDSLRELGKTVSFLSPCVA